VIILARPCWLFSELSGSMHTSNLSLRTVLSFASALTLSLASSLWWVWDADMCCYCVFIRSRLLTTVLRACKLYTQVFNVSGLIVIPINPLCPCPYRIKVVSIAMPLQMPLNTPALWCMVCSPFMKCWLTSSGIAAISYK
jgi:hypothetical protein